MRKARSAMTNDADQSELLNGSAEADENYVGDKTRKETAARGQAQQAEARQFSLV